MFRIMIYAPDKKSTAKEAIQLLFKMKKTDIIHKKLGLLFGYSKDRIEEFIERK